jgi:ABC-type lipoprotein release transport system permease subunit
MNLLTIIGDGLRRRKIRTALSVLGIAIAATALFTLVSLRQGYEAGMRAELENMGLKVQIGRTFRLPKPMDAEASAKTVGLKEMSKIIGQITTNWDFATAKKLAEDNFGP